MLSSFLKRPHVQRVMYTCWVCLSSLVKETCPRLGRWFRRQGACHKFNMQNYILLSQGWQYSLIIPVLGRWKEEETQWKLASQSGSNNEFYLGNSERHWPTHQPWQQKSTVYEWRSRKKILSTAVCFWHLSERFKNFPLIYSLQHSVFFPKSVWLTQNTTFETFAVAEVFISTQFPWTAGTDVELHF